LTAGFIDKFVKVYPNVTDEIDEQSIISALRYGQSLSKISCASIGALGAFFKTLDINYPNDSDAQCSFCKLTL
jgi:hypothetical protein